jgi:hypothetical protein
MSHDATNWAIKQRGLKPALKVVLWHLCDRYNPDMGCFPSQETLAFDCEVPRSTLNVYLGELEDAGLIAREQRREKASNRQERTRYRFPFEADFVRKNCELPSPETGHGVREAESSFSDEPSPENAESRVQNLDSNLVREPVREPVNLREGARDVSEDPKKIEAAFWALVKDWPGFAAMPKEPAKAVWCKLSADDRRIAADRLPGWLALLKAQRKSHVPAPATYLREKLWGDVPDAAAQPEKPVVHMPFSKAWQALRLSELLRPVSALPPMTTFQRSQVALGGEGAARIRAEHAQRWGWPKVAAMHERARSAQGVTVPRALVSASEGFRSVSVGSPIFAAWKRLHEARGWPLPEMGSAEWICFPASDGPDVEAALRNFEHAINEGPSV